MNFFRYGCTHSYEDKKIKNKKKKTDESSFAVEDDPPSFSTLFSYYVPSIGLCNHELTNTRYPICRNFCFFSKRSFIQNKTTELHRRISFYIAVPSDTLFRRIGKGDVFKTISVSLVINVRRTKRIFEINVDNLTKS